MSEAREFDTTLEELEAAGGERTKKSKRLSLPAVVQHFLETTMVWPEGLEKKAQYKQRETEAEMRGFYKGQERLREVIAIGGTDAIAHLADVRAEGQQRPTMIGDMRVWFG